MTTNLYLTSQPDLSYSTAAALFWYELAISVIITCLVIVLFLTIKSKTKLLVQAGIQAPYENGVKFLLNASVLLSVSTIIQAVYNVVSLELKLNIY